MHQDQEPQQDELPVIQEESVDSDQPERRVRKPTEKGLEFYIQQRDKLLYQLEIARKALDEHIIQLENNFPKSIINIENAERELQHSNVRFAEFYDIYLDFLSRHVTEEGIADREAFTSNQLFVDTKNKLRVMFDKLSDATEQRYKEIETRSEHSFRSRNSQTSMLALKKREEVAAAKVKLELMRKELKDKETELKQQEIDIATKQAEADFTDNQSEHRSVIDVPLIDLVERTKQYVMSQSDLNIQRQYNIDDERKSYGSPQPSVDQRVTVRDCDQHTPIEYQITKYLCRKDIVRDRLVAFNGKHEHYLSWKDTFRSVMLEVDASPSEEIDLLLKWAGSASSQINSIKTANSGNMMLGLRRAWERLDNQYGSPEKVDLALRTKLNNFQRITFKDKAKMFELSDILSEIRAVKERPHYTALLSYLDTAPGINPTISKLPPTLQNKWRDRALSYKRTNNVLFPPFTYFCDFIYDMAIALNDPCFDFSLSYAGEESKTRQPRQISVAKTTAVSPVQGEPLPCFIHKGRHPLLDYRTFRHKTLEERRQLLKQQGICFRCCSGKHLSRDCTQAVRCQECNEQRHCTAMHVYRWTNQGENQSGERHGGENVNGAQRQFMNVNTSCTEICQNVPGRSCAKIVLVNISHKESQKSPIRAYAIVDDQSNYSLAKSELFDLFDVKSVETQYSLKSCGGKVTLTGRQSSGFVVQSIDYSEQFEMPVLTECDMVPDNRKEIPTPEVAANHPHLACIAGLIPALDNKADILLLIGRDMMPAHYVLDQKLGDVNQPFAQKLKLGWVIIGECCLDGAHVPYDMNSMKTFIHSNGRPSIFQPCENAFEKEALFATSKNDNKIGPSWEDKKFCNLMDKEMIRNDQGDWVAPLPFKQQREVLPNNRQCAERRTRNFVFSLKKDPVKKQHTLDFMKDLFEKGHAEKAPALNPTDEAWFLPLFGVYHPKKKDRIRIVFDSSAKCRGLSLNDVLMTGPNLTSNLLGVLMRFRKGKVAVMADIEQMFYSFQVKPEHRRYLRFVWPEGNDLDKDLVDYQMNVHVFGNSPSPAVATYGLQKTADIAEPTAGTDVKHLVKRDFYVDDALTSHESSDEAIDILKRTQSALQDFGNIRLHKICSNSREVLAAFNKEDLAKDLKDLDLENDFPLQRSLGVCWNVQLDTFTFLAVPDNNAFTHRGALSTINSLYDPLGFAAPFTITGRILRRECLAERLEWDEPLPQQFLERWKTWKASQQGSSWVHFQ